MRKLLAFGMALVGVVGLGTLAARPVPQEAPAVGPRADARPLRADAISVRLLLGVGDAAPTPWSGKVAVSAGEVLAVEPWRFRPGDSVTGPDSWAARSLVLRKAATAKVGGPSTAPVAKKKAGAARKKAGAAGGPGALVGPTGVIVQVRAPANAALIVTTDQGEARIPLGDLTAGSPRLYLDGRIEARSVPPHAPLVQQEGQEDFPAAAPDGRLGAWIAYIEHQPRGPEATAPLTAPPEDFRAYVPEGGGDQVKLLHFDGASVGRILDVTGPGRDVWRPAVARGAEGKVVVVWPENLEGNWDLYARTYDPSDEAWDEPRRLTDDPGTDTDPVLVTAPDGRVHLAWQAWRDGQAEIYLAPLDGAGDPKNISDHPANDWSPSIAVDASGNVRVAFDSYRNGSYDVLLYQGEDRIQYVAQATTFEARPSLAIDRRGRSWVAYEERTENWGKDFGVHDREAGTPLYRESTVRVRCVDGDRVLDTGDPFAAAPEVERPMLSFPRLAVDGAGRPWLLYRQRRENIWRDSAVPTVGALWIEYATARTGDSWSPPRPVPRSENLLDNRPALVASGAGPLLAVYATDGRLHRQGSLPAGTTRKAAAASGRSWVNNDLFVAALVGLGDAADPEPSDRPAQESPSATPVHPDEAEAIARMRAHRIEAGGKTYQLLRGEFHRHTEISSDGGGDGSLEDMWRYGLDVAGLDWIGNGDHDNGNGREYTWWITQKTTDLYHNPPAFVPMFTYERSVPYPGGHRNVMFAYRGVRTLPRLMGVDGGGIQMDVNGRDLDAQMLYRYLNALDGICAAHTSATSMGTDWRANDPKAEPFVEIYQGDRDSYEYFGEPRVAHGPNDAAGGWQPLGMVWNALAMQYRLGFQASSDHISTHISFAVALAEEPTRAAIHDAFRTRHCYAATDNILLDVRCGDRLMGDEFTADGPVALRILAHGTAPIARVDIIKDFHHVYSAEPGEPRVEFTWTDEDGLNRGPSWYYVRVLQADGELAWGSPMWIHAEGENR